MGVHGKQSLLCGHNSFSVPDCRLQHHMVTTGPQRHETHEKPCGAAMIAAADTMQDSLQVSPNYSWFDVSSLSPDDQFTRDDKFIRRFGRPPRSVFQGNNGVIGPERTAIHQVSTAVQYWCENCSTETCRCWVEVQIYWTNPRQRTFFSSEKFPVYSNTGSLEAPLPLPQTRSANKKWSTFTLVHNVFCVFKTANKPKTPGLHQL